MKTATLPGYMKAVMGNPLKNIHRGAGRMRALLLAAACILLPGIASGLPGSTPAPECRPVPGGPPNSCPGVASTGGNGSPDVGAGNPINVITGNKYEREVDMPALPGVLGLEIVRHHNSAYSKPGEHNGSMGRGWRLSYQTELFDIYGKIQIVQADGGRVIFDRDPKNPNLCSTTNPANGTMVIGVDSTGQREFTWTWTNGRKLHFNTAGKLDRIIAPTGERVTLLYDDRNVLKRVTDPQNRSLDLVNFDRAMPNHFHGAQFIDSPVGRFEYEYGSELPAGTAALFDQQYLLALMTRVRLPTGFDPAKPTHGATGRGATISRLSHIYHHEDPRNPWLLTGISIETIGPDNKPVTKRYSTYGYDADARAIMSTHAGNVGKVTLDTKEAGKTVLTNSLGQTTTYLHAILAGEHRLLEVRGAGCSTCGETNVRYGYNSAGQLTETTKLDANGTPISGSRTELDKLGRTARIGRFAYVQGKVQPVQWLTRFEYQGNSFTPSVIARPSVVPGKEALTRIVYNAAGQPLSVTETGWAPTLDGAQPAGKVERTTTYRYASIDGGSRLIMIDGPLPNGKTNSPADSDITHIEYDKQNDINPPQLRPGEIAQYVQRDGIITSITSPGNFKSKVEYDQVGRIASVTGPDGRTSSFRYTPRGQPISITRDGVIQTTTYDGFERPVEWGYSESGRYQAVRHLSYDDAGRAAWAASALGIVTTSIYDTEDQLLEASTLSNAIKQTQRYTYDAAGRPLTVTDPGGGTRRIAWNAQGLPDELTDALGRTTRFRYDATGNIVGVTEAANTVLARLHNTETGFELDPLGRPTSIVAPNGATTRYITDDFGQTIATIGADSGTTTRSFDAAGRLVASTDANGNRASYDYDAAGRVVRQTVTEASRAGALGKATSTSWRYEGMRLVAIDHPEQSERYSYDAQGRVSVKTVILTLDGGARVTHATRYRYDALGQLAGVTLPDGSALDYQRNGQQQITALERNPVHSSWLRWLLPAQSIVKNLERDVVGLKRLTFGNGIEAMYQRSKDGVLARIVYRDPRLQAAPGERTAALESLLGISPAFAASTTMAKKAVVQLPGALGLPADATALLDHRYLWDAQSNLLHTQDRDAASSYAYDAQDRLIAAGTAPSEKGGASFARYYYDGNGNRLLAQEGIADQGDTHTNTVKASYAPGRNRWMTVTDDAANQVRYDATGQPEAIDARTYVWDALGKLLEVRQDQRTLARYRYNHRGERIEKIVGSEHTYYLYDDRKLVAELDAKGTIRRQYVYLAEQPVAVIDTADGDVAGGEHTGFGKFTADIATIWKAWLGKSESIAYVHGNHLGATELVTDAKGKPLWQAGYAPFGKLMQVDAKAMTGTAATAFQFNLRLPGQYADQETGLHYNDHRYYDPARGQYLTADPMGLSAGANSYAYAGGNPLKYIDPSGLVLFAFDGSGNDLHDSALLTNVVKFEKLYQDTAYYITGVGTKDIPTGIGPRSSDPRGIGDLANAYTGKARITAMIDNLNRYSDTSADNTVVDIDIVGFSRGAAEGRDFANQLIANVKDGYYHYQSSGKEQCQKVNFRFMGLFDTVLSTHTGSYQLGIPDAFQYVAQAMALNEYRGGLVGFPMESILGASVPQGQTRIERGFLGAHSDIGGGFPDSDLAKVALVWMIKQAEAAGVSMKNPSLNTIIGNPVLHDSSSNLLHGGEGGGPTTTSVDRDVRYYGGAVEKQRDTSRSVMTYSDTVQFINYKNNPNSRDSIAGTVDMQGYLYWLNRNGYNIDMTVP